MCFQWLGLNHSSCRRKQVIIFVASSFFFFNHFRQWEHSTRTWLSYHEQPHWGFRCNVLNTSELYYKKLLLHNLKANRKWRLRAFVPVNYVTQSTTLLSGKTQLSLLKNEVEGRWESTVHRCQWFFEIRTWHSRVPSGQPLRQETVLDQGDHVDYCLRHDADVWLYAYEWLWVKLYMF